MKSNQHIVGLDGLRGLAVIMVMLYHFSHVTSVTNTLSDEIFTKILRMGWIGVDIFFVLSGFLITRILLWSKNLDLQNYLKLFYIKRSLRIFPLYYLYIIFIFFIFYPMISNHLGVIEQNKIRSAQESIPWFFLYVSNIKQVLNGSFFGAGLGHLWSLSIEEQFYIIWPFVIFFVDVKHLSKVFLGIITISLLLRIIMYLLSVPGEIIYVFTFTRIDGLVFGAYVALLSIGSTKVLFDEKYLSYSFYALFIVCLILLYNLGPRVEMHPILFTVFLTLLGICFAILIWVLQSSKDSISKSFFSSRILVFFGKYSYGLYIFHPLLRQLVMKVIGEPKVIFGSQIIWEIGVLIVCTAISLIVALLSWNLFEKWFLKSKDFFLKLAIRNR
ncbi:acyltransferase family protein [Pedobacter sp. PWIIR3]